MRRRDQLDLPSVRPCHLNQSDHLGATWKQLHVQLVTDNVGKPFFQSLPPAHQPEWQKQEQPETVAQDERQALIERVGAYESTVEIDAQYRRLDLDGTAIRDRKGETPIDFV